MNKIVSVTLLILGVILLFSIDNIIDKNTSNSTLKSIYDNRNIIGSVCIAVAYYFYTVPETNNLFSIKSQLEIPSKIPQLADELPSYDQSIGTSDVLKL